LEVVNGRENVIADLLDVAVPETQEAGRLPVQNWLTCLDSKERIGKYESPYLPALTLGLRHVEVELSSEEQLMHDLFLKANIPAKKKAVISAYNYLQMNATEDNFPSRGVCCHSP
jgi:hypothetical protein